MGEVAIPRMAIARAACFWLIKALCTIGGETAADYLNENLGIGRPTRRTL
jgi:uncharacterized membrane-anchored protein